MPYAFQSRSRNNVPTSMLYVQSEGKPWHGSGTPVAEAPDPHEANRLAGLDYKVGLFDIAALWGPADDTGTRRGMVDIPESKAVFRMDDSGNPVGKPWAVVSDRLRHVQNAQVAEMLADLGFKVHTAGKFDEGQLVWWMGRLGVDAEIVPGDAVDLNLLIANSFDTTLRLSLGLTSVRVVCINTCVHAMDDARARGKFIAIRHTESIHEKMSKAAEALGFARKRAEEVVAEYRGLAEISVTEAQEDEILKFLIPAESSQGANKRQIIRDIHHGSDTIAGLGLTGTGWGMFNAVTEFVDHQLGLSKTQEERLRGGWFGLGAELKTGVREAIRVVVGKGATVVAAPEPETITI